MADLKFVDQHNMVACLEKTEENTEFHQIVDFLSTCSINYALTVSPTIYASYIEQFWNTATSKTVNSVKQIHAIVDGKAVVISESSVRSDLLFNDEDGIACLTNDEIFENLALMGYEQLSTKLTFQKGGGDSVERAITTDASLVAAQDSDNILKTQSTEDASKNREADDKIKPMFADSDFDELDDDMDNVEGETVHTATTGVSTVSAPVTTVGVAISTAEPRTPPTTAATAFIDEDLTIAQTLVKMMSEKAKVKGIAFSDVEETPRLNRSTTTLQPLPTIDPKYKGKGILVEEEPEKPEKVKRRDQGLAQIESDAELAQRLHEEELAELDRAQKERQKQEEATSAALAEEFDEIQARIDVDHELVVRLTHEEQEKYTIKERIILLAKFFERRKKQLAAERAEAIRNKPPTRTQVKNRMITYLNFDGNTLFEPNEEDGIWKNQQDYNLISWRLFDSCGVHVLLMNTRVAIHMMIEKKYPLTQEMLSRMLNRRLEVDSESEMAFELLRFTKSQLQK
ncbi:hypothetical protein Tco_0412653 [Tanacetum coccineum]